jgi:hypothetical protein
MVKPAPAAEASVVNENYHISLVGKCPKKQRVTFFPIRSHMSDPSKLPKEL